MKNYIALFETVEGKDSFGVVFPDFPGCVSAGDNYADALRMAHEALAGHVSGMKADGDKIPEPRTLEEIKENWVNWKEWENEYNFVVGYVTLLPLKSQAKRINVMLDEILLAQIDKVTGNRSAFLADAARKALEVSC